MSTKKAVGSSNSTPQALSGNNYNPRTAGIFYYLRLPAELAPEVFLDSVDVIPLNSISINQESLVLRVVNHEVPACLMEEFEGVLVLSSVLVCEREGVSDIVLSKLLEDSPCHKI